MGYRSINNLYKDQTIFMFKEVYALEKVHGTSAHIKFERARQWVELDENSNLTEEEFQSKWPDRIQITFFSGGASYEQFVALFNILDLEERFRKLGFNELTVYGEAYGGKMQGMSKSYGPTLRFIAFELKGLNGWFNVPAAEHFTKELGLEFTPYEKIPAILEAINVERDRDSIVAINNGMGPGHIREGVVLRPLHEFVSQGENGGTIRAKHKRDEFKETKTKREVLVADPNYLKVLEDAQLIADEWVVEQRLLHILDKLPKDNEDLGLVIKAMIEDVEREAMGEIVFGKETRAAISKATVRMYKQRQQNQLEAP